MLNLLRRTLRLVFRLAFRAAAAAAVVWVAREAMRRWVDGPEAPQVAGSWQGWDAGNDGTEAKQDPAIKKAPSPGKAPVPKKAPAGKVPPAVKSPPEKTAAFPKSPSAKKAAAKYGPAKRPAPAGSPAWIAADGLGDVPPTHPVKVKTASRLYRVPGMPMYDRTVADRCYTTPEAAEADGFTRASR